MARGGGWSVVQGPPPSGGRREDVTGRYVKTRTLALDTVLSFLHAENDKETNMLWNKDELDREDALFKLARLNDIDTDDVNWVEQLERLKTTGMLIRAQDDA